MPLFSFEGRSPTVHPGAWVAPTATLVGDVVVEAGASVWYGAVLRADFGRIVVRAGANVQDNSVLHGGEDPVTEIGAGATVGHMCVVHGASIGAEALIGNGSTVQDGARIGARTLIGAGSLVPPARRSPTGCWPSGRPRRSGARCRRAPRAGSTPTRLPTRSSPAVMPPECSRSADGPSPGRRPAGTGRCADPVLEPSRR